MRLPRPRYTILSLMLVVLLASLVLTYIVALREQHRRAIALRAALAEYENAKLTREVAEIAVVEYSQSIDRVKLPLAQSDAEREADRRNPAMRAYDRDRTIKELQTEVEQAKVIEKMRKAEYDRLNAVGTGLFW
jgi:hypothetical protein